MKNKNRLKKIPENQELTILGENIKILNKIGNGGNSTVYHVIFRGENCALKEFRTYFTGKKLEIKKKRFLNEIKILEEHADVDGVIKIKFHSSYEHSKYLFYIMPLGTPSLVWSKEKPIKLLINNLSRISKTLADLEIRGVAHRDIKPDNIIVINDLFYLSDFGLAIDKSNPRISIDEKMIGPWNTIAPEMKRQPASSNPYLADSYSFAKTIWILLTGNNFCFEGQYSSDGEESLVDLSIYFCSKFEYIIKKCTSNIPVKRLKHSEILEILSKCAETFDDQIKRSKEEWRELKYRLFAERQPSIATWFGYSSIYNILKIITKQVHKNHTYHPEGGGLDLSGVEKSHETSCIELIFDGIVVICCPEKLSFYSPTDDGENDYFILKTKKIPPVLPNNIDRNDECFTEIEPLVYTDYRCKEYNDFNGEDVPSSSRTIYRQLQGSFAIFMKQSQFDKIQLVHDGATYDSYAAIHEKINGDKLFLLLKRYLGGGEKSDFYANFKFMYPQKTKLKRVLLNRHENLIIEQFIDFYERSASTYENRNGEIISFEDKSKISKILENGMKKQIEIDTFLKKYSESDIQLVTSVMYAGRDNPRDSNDCEFGIPLDEMKQRNSDLQSSRHSLSSKSFASIAQYLKRGKAMYS